MTGLDEEAYIGVHERSSHGDVLTIWEDSGAVGTALLDEAKDVVNSIYRHITGRTASRSTIKDYTRRLADGWTLNDVEDDISDR